MKKRKSTGHTDVAVVYDGSYWRIVSTDGEIASVAAPLSRLPEDLLAKMREVDVRSARFILSGDVHKLEKAIPASTGFAKACDAIRASLAEISGEEALEALVAGRFIRWTKRKSFTHSGHVDGNIAGDLAAQLEDENITRSRRLSREETERSLEVCLPVQEGGAYLLLNARAGRCTSHARCVLPPVM